VIHPSVSLIVIAMLLGILMIVTGVFHLLRVFDSAEQHGHGGDGDDR
jgi:uncharacterized membrane protein HdeD (DUF308 family)